MINFLKRIWFRAWVIGSGIAFVLTNMIGGYTQPFTLAMLILISQGVGLLFLKGYNRKYLWWLNLPLYFLFLRWSNLMIGNDDHLNVYWIMFVAYLAIVMVGQGMLFVIFRKKNFYWILLNIAAIVLYYLLWKGIDMISFEVIRDNLLYHTSKAIITFLSGAVFGIVTGMGLELSMKR